MEFNSFIFQIVDRPYNCGCYGACSCQEYESDMDYETSVESAVDYIAEAVKNNESQYIDYIYVNGVKITVNNCVNRGKRYKYVNPITSFDVKDIQKFVPLEMIPEEVAVDAVVLLHSVYEAVKPLVKDFITETNKVLEAREAKQKEATLDRDRKELERLKKLYPDM
jgi:hypothetical protein